MADETKELKIVISSDTNDAEKGLNSFGGSLRKVGEIAAGIGLAKLTGEVVEFGKQFVVGSVKAFQESEKMNAQLQAVLQSTKGIAGVTSDAAINLSKALQKQTTYSDEAVLSAENMLLTFTKIGKNTFPEATKTVLNMSTALGQDTKNSAIQLGKALQDPILGVTALRRVGVNFSDEQKNVIKNLVETGKSLEAQKIILAELNTEFGGSAAAAAQTYAGRLAQLRNQIDDIQEVIGKLIVNAITPLINAIMPLINFISQVADGTRSWNDILDLLNQKMAGLGDVADRIAKFFQAQFAVIIKQITDLWKEHKQELILIAELLGGIVVANLLIAAATITVLIQAGLKLVDVWLDMVRTIKEELMPILNSLNDFFKKHADTIEFIKDAYVSAWEKIAEITGLKVKSIKEMVTGLGKFIIEAIVPGLNSLSEVSNLINNIKGFTGSKKALGGYAGGVTLVGERGPELVNLPSGSYVNTNEQSKQMMGGATVNIYNPSVRSDSDISDIVNQVKSVLGRDTELARFRAR